MVKKIITVNANSTKTLNIKDLKVGAAKLSVTNLNSNGDSVEDKVADVIGEMKTPTDAVIENGIATFNALDPVALDALSISIDYVQEGTGTPSPDNVRTITGWNAAEITVSDGTNETEYNISFGTAGTVYKGTLNVLTGELTVTHSVVDLGTLSWRLNADTNYFYGDLSGKAIGNTEADNVFDCYAWSNLNASDMPDLSARASANTTRIYIRDEQYTDDDTFTTAVSGHYMYYELATPETYQLTPTQVYALVGSNTVSADCGSITECEYTQIATANNLNYSFNEIDTGMKWIDGKTIYRKVIDFGALPNATSKLVEHGITNLGEIVTLRGIAVDMISEVGTYTPIPKVSLRTAEQIMLFANSTYVGVNTADNETDYTITRIILEYTKTT